MAGYETHEHDVLLIGVGGAGLRAAIAACAHAARLDNMLMLIGSTTSGLSTFLAGLIIARYQNSVKPQKTDGNRIRQSPNRFRWLYCSRLSA